MNIKWESEKYKNDFSFVHQYGESVLELIEMPEAAGGEKPRAVDLGCGNGALTEKLSHMGFDVIGIDDSEEMLKTAAQLYPALKFQKGNAVDFVLPYEADVIFSNAVFHWIDKDAQGKMARNLLDRLKNGGQLVCEFGGYGCAESVHSALEGAFNRRELHYPRYFYFPKIGEYASLLEETGFRVESAFLFDRPTPQKGEHGLTDWIKMFVKAPFEGLDVTVKEEILNEVEEVLKQKLCINGTWFIDYVRIRVRAVKP